MATRIDFKECDFKIECSRDYLQHLITGEKNTIKVPTILQVQKGDTVSIIKDEKRFVFDVLHISYNNIQPVCILTVKPEKLPFL